MRDKLAGQIIKHAQEVGQGVPDMRQVKSFFKKAISVLFPVGGDVPETENLVKEIEALEKQLVGLLESLSSKLPKSASAIASDFFEKLSAVHDDLQLDAQAIFDGDPAETSLSEICAAYPGFFAVAAYRIAHLLRSLGVPTVPRMITEYAHQKTGIDISPGAIIGKSLCIDHGTGIVIGETAVIQDRVKLYQGVTLGALSVDKTMSGTKRHPTIESDVVIYANATILGGNTVIGHNCTIGGNVWITSSVSPHSSVFHAPSRSRTLNTRTKK